MEPRSKAKENAIRYALAGVSCMTAGFATNPIDVIKVRMQLDNELADHGGKTIHALRNRYYKGWIPGAYRIFQDEGSKGLLRGATASVIREGIYSTLRVGSYEPLKELFGAKDRHHTPLWKKICAGAIAGVIGSLAAVPTDLVKVRMQAVQNKPQYKNTFAAFAEIVRKDGVKGLYVGTVPTVQRAAIVTATQIPSYDHTKHFLINHRFMDEGPALHVVSSMVAGFLTAFTTSPTDVIKTRMMSQKQQLCGTIKYSSTFDCLMKTIRSEGVMGLYKGFIPNWMRIGPHTIISFFIFEQLRVMTGINPV